jgi:hypothetical protein
MCARCWKCLRRGCMSKFRWCDVQPSVRALSLPMLAIFYIPLQGGHCVYSLTSFRKNIMESKDCVLSSFHLLNHVAEYASARDVCSAALVNKSFHKVYNRDELWEQLCSIHGFRPLVASTRTRGKQSFRSVYSSALCIECRRADGSKGSVVIDTNGGSYTRMGGIDGPGNALVVLCIECFRAVQHHTTHGDRMRYALQRSKHRLPYHAWTTVLGKIPFVKPGAAPRRKRTSAAHDSSTDTAHPLGAQAGSARQKRARDQYEDAGHNDYLLKMIPK